MIEEENNLIIIDENANKEEIDIYSDRFKKMMFLYEAALKEVKTKIEIIQDELKLFVDYEPIEYISTRLKEPQNIIEKLKRKNYTLTYGEMFEKINDIAGIRIVCNFKSDVYKIVQIIENFQDVRILNKKDFMKNPKKSGYMSYHLITEIPVSFSQGTMWIKVEIQIRTLGMHFWASLEHKLKYKNSAISKTESKNLVKYAKVINNIDENMLTISNKLEEPLNTNIMIAADSNENLKKKKFDFKL